MNDSGNFEQTYIDSDFKAVSGSNNTQACPLTTVSALAAKYGNPAAVKIDVEGYEPAVLEGMTSPPSYVTFEIHTWVPGKLPPCIARVGSLGDYRFNFRESGISNTLMLNNWLTGTEFVDWWMKTRPPVGDVHAYLGK